MREIDQFLKDRRGNKIYIGDEIVCTTHDYASYDKGESTTVIGIDNRCLVLLNERSNTKTCRYLPDNWLLKTRYNRNHFKTEDTKQEEKPMEHGSTLQVAYLIPDGMTKEEFIAYSVASGSKLISIIESTPHRLKARIHEQLRRNPSERWYLVNTYQIAEVTAPVTIRGW